MKKFILSIIFLLLLVPSTALSWNTSPFGPVPPDNTAYNAAAWDNSYLAPTQDAVRDQLEIMITAATPGGIDTYIQYNDGGAFGGSAGLTYDNVLDVLTIDNVVIITTLNPSVGNTVDLGTVLLPFQDAFFSGTVAAPIYNAGIADSQSGSITIHDGGTLQLFDDGNDFGPSFMVTDGTMTLRLTGSLEASAAVIAGSALLPDAADNATIGTADLEWASLYLHDGSVIYGQADQSNTLISSATGWSANLGFTVLGNLNLGADDDVANLYIHHAGTLVFNDASDDTTVTFGPVADGTTVLGITGSLNVSVNVAGATYGSDSSISDAELLAIDNATKNSFNHVVNGSFNIWSGGANAVPDGFTLRATPTIVREANTSPLATTYHIKVTCNGETYEGIQVAGGAANYLKVRPSTVYTLSFYYKVDAADDGGYWVKSYNGAAAGTSHHDSGNDLTSTTWTIKTFTFTTDVDADNVSLAFFPEDDTNVIYLAGIHLMEGNSTYAYSYKPLSRGGDVTVEVDESKFSHKIPILINGSLYYIMLTAS